MHIEIKLTRARASGGDINASSNAWHFGHARVIQTPKLFPVLRADSARCLTKKGESQADSSRKSSLKPLHIPSIE